MKNYVFTAANSRFVAGAQGFGSVVVNSTLTVDANGSLVSWSGGDGADVDDFLAVNVDGEIAAYGSGDSGLDIAYGESSNILSLIVGTAGDIVGAKNGIRSSTPNVISNAGTILGEGDDGISDYPHFGGAGSLINAETGQIIGYAFGVFVESVGLGRPTQTIDNLGLIEGQMDWAVSLQSDAKTTIVNAAGGRMMGANGVDDDLSKGVQTLVNAGLIDGESQFAIEIDQAAGPTSISNASTGRIVGGLGIYEGNSGSTVNINNSGLIDGQGADGVEIANDASGGGGAVNNAATGQITAYEYGIAFISFKGAVTIDNSGLIWGEYGYGVDLAQSGAASVINAANATLKGKDFGIYSNDETAGFALANAGEIEGSEGGGVEIYGAVGAINISNAGTGHIVGDNGVYDDKSQGAVKLSNAGLIDGGAGDGVYVFDDTLTAAAEVVNTGLGQIVGQGNGIEFDDDFGAVTIRNSGLLWGEQDRGAYLYQVGAVGIINGAKGVIKGGDDGLDVVGNSGGFTLSNAGLIAGASDDGLYVVANAGDESIANLGSGAISGKTGIYDAAPGASTRTIANSGAIAGLVAYGIDETAGGTLHLSNTASGRILGESDAIVDGASTGTRTITNAGYIQSAASAGVFEATAGDATITNLAGGQIIGGGSGGWGVADIASSGTLTINNAGAISGGSAAIDASGGATIFFSNSGVINGDVDLSGADNVKITGGVVNGNIDMHMSTDVENYVSNGGMITGEVEFGDNSDNLATLEAGALGTEFSLTGATTFDFLSASASTGTTAATRDTLIGWQSSDVINLSAFAPHDTFADVTQFFASPTLGPDLISLKGSNFTLEIKNLSTAHALTAANFVF